MNIIIIFVLIYIISVIINYRFVRIAHSKKGRWSNCNVELSDAVLTFCPIINVASCIFYVFMSPYRNKKINYNQLFKVEK